MTVRPMQYLPANILLTKAIQVKPRDLTGRSFQRLIDDMVESMYWYHGVGIAANQIGSRYRLCIIQLPEDQEPRVLINPRITRRAGEREVTEGCLSLPGHRGNIIRSERVWATALDRHGAPLNFDGVDGLLAQALEHETDHLDGIAYIDHLRSPDDLFEVERQPDGPEGDNWHRSDSTED